MFFTWIILFIFIRSKFYVITISSNYVNYFTLKSIHNNSLLFEHLPYPVYRKIWLYFILLIGFPLTFFLYSLFIYYYFSMFFPLFFVIILIAVTKTILIWLIVLRINNFLEGSPFLFISRGVLPGGEGKPELINFEDFDWSLPRAADFDWSSIRAPDPNLVSPEIVLPSLTPRSQLIEDVKTFIVPEGYPYVATPSSKESPTIREPLTKKIKLDTSACTSISSDSETIVVKPSTSKQHVDAIAEVDVFINNPQQLDLVSVLPVVGDSRTGFLSLDKQLQLESVARLVRELYDSSNSLD